MLHYVDQAPSDPANQPISGFDMEKVTTTLKQFVRDWSDEVFNRLIFLFGMCVLVRWQFDNYLMTHMVNGVNQGDHVVFVILWVVPQDHKW